jgi:uncharacterized protein YbjT (DUF2867 family)
LPILAWKYGRQAIKAHLRHNLISHTWRIFVQERTALLFGATGLVGGELLELLLADSAYRQVTVIGRRQLPLQSDKLRQVVADLDEIETLGDCFAVDDVFCCLGTTIKKAKSREAFRRVDFAYPLKIAAMAKQSGAGFFVISAVGADAGSPFFYNKVKGELEQALKGLALPALHIFRPSLLLGDRAELRIGERLAAIVMKPLSFMLTGPLRKYRPIPARTVAAAMLQAAEDGRAGVFTHYF